MRVGGRVLSALLVALLAIQAALPTPAVACAWACAASGGRVVAGDPMPGHCHAAEPTRARVVERECCPADTTALDALPVTRTSQRALPRPSALRSDPTDLTGVGGPLPQASRLTDHSPGPPGPTSRLTRLRI